MTTLEDTTLQVELVSIDELHPDPANPRRIGERELETLTRSIRENGFIVPVLARRETKTVIGGHQRLLAARRLGMKEVPVIWLDISHLRHPRSWRAQPARFDAARGSLFRGSHPG